MTTPHVALLACIVALSQPCDFLEPCEITIPDGELYGPCVEATCKEGGACWMKDGVGTFCGAIVMVNPGEMPGPCPPLPLDGCGIPIGNEVSQTDWGQCAIVCDDDADCGPGMVCTSGGPDFPFSKPNLCMWPF